MSKASDMRRAKAIELASGHTPTSGHVLEVSCGDGRALLALQEAGYQVTGSNFTKYGNEPENLDIRHGVDLLKGLPFRDESFDTVMLLDVMEHLPDHDQAVSELVRVCKTGGHVIIMTPNIMKIASRVHFLLTGFFKLKRDFIGFDVPVESAFAFHNYPVHLPVFLYLLHSHGLALRTFTASVYKRKSFVWYLMTGPAIAFFSLLKLGYGEKNLKGTPSARELRRCLLSRAGLCGEFLFMVAERKKEPSRSSPEKTTALPKWSSRWDAEEPVNSVQEHRIRSRQSCAP